MLLYKLLQGHVDCPDILNKINYLVLCVKSRTKQMCYPNACKNKVQFNCPVNRLIRLSNNFNIDTSASSLIVHFKIYLNSTQFT